MKNNFLKYIDNKILIKKNQRFALIIGSQPSKGARSPLLWNRAYKKLGIKGKMYPADVKEKKLGKFIHTLKKNKKFLGCSVTIPYKEKVIPYLDSLDINAAKIGSVNHIINNSGKLKGFNTDYFGSFYTLKKICNKKNNQRILVLGCGGAGKACIISVISFFKNSKIYLFNRSKKKLKNFSNLKKSKNLIKIVDNYQQLSEIKKLNLVINTTSVGFDIWSRSKKKYYNNLFCSPLSESGNLKCVKSKNYKLFKKINYNIFFKNILNTFIFLKRNPNIKVFDIIYSPKETTVLKISNLLGIFVINGSLMNLTQAVEGFKIVNRYGNKNRITKAMVNNGK